MVKQEWYNVAADKRLKLILELIDKGYSADDINNYFYVKTKRVIPDFMNSRGYSKQNNTYVLKKAAKTNKEVVPTKDNNTSVIQIDANTTNVLIDIAKDYNKIQEIIHWYYNRHTHNNNEEMALTTSVIEIVDTSLPIPKLDGEIKRTTIRVNEHILKKFNNVWKEKYSQYKHQDLLAIALEMFIEKYK